MLRYVFLDLLFCIKHRLLLIFWFKIVMAILTRHHCKVTQLLQLWHI